MSKLGDRIDKNLGYQFLGYIILNGVTYRMLEDTMENNIKLCTMTNKSIIVGKYGIGIPDENIVYVITLKKDYINKFEGKSLKVKMRKLFKDLDNHNGEYLNKYVPLDEYPKAFWNDVVIPLSEDKDILPILTVESITIKNNDDIECIRTAGTDNNGVLKVLEFNPKYVSNDNINKLREFGFVESYITHGHLINIKCDTLPNSFTSLFNNIIMEMTDNILQLAKSQSKPSDTPKKKSKRGRKVEMMDLNTGEVIMTFDCTGDANEYLGKRRSAANINSCILGKSKQAYGYKWRYAS